MSLLQTKFHAPAPPNRGGRISHVSRPRLLQKLNAAIGKKLSLVCAPAGFGKSTLLSEWIEQNAAGVELPNGRRLPSSAAWLSLDAGDNDAIRFWSYFVGALQTLDPTIGDSTLVQLQSPQPVSHEVMLTSLLNDLSARSDLLILILDDYHLIETPAIHRALLYLLEHLPAQLHIVICSRADPPLTLARWRGQGQLAELRIDDLRFDGGEVAGFLEEVMGLQLTPQAIVALEGRTEGWVAGLQLAALSIQGVADRESFINRFSGSNRYIVDYLVEEVLSQQPEEIHSFLLRTSILEQMSGPLCDALLGFDQNGASTSSQEILEELEQANLFLIPLDHERIWFRYHHLFGDVLRLRLRKSFGDTIVDLHRRASRWYEAAGHVEAAVSHALAIPDYDRAATLVEGVAMSIIFHQSKVYSARQLIEQIPPATILSRPRLLLPYGVILALFGQFARVEELLLKGEEIQKELDLELRDEGGFLALRSFMARAQGLGEISLDLAQRALDKLPMDEFVMRGAAYQSIGLAYIRRGESARGQEMLKISAAHSLEGKAHYLTLVAYEESASEQRIQGQLTEAIQSCNEALRLAEQWGAQYLPAVGIIYVVRGEVLVEWNQLEDATESLLQGLRLLYGTTEMNLLARGYAALARAKEATGKLSDALSTLQQGDERLVTLQLAAPILLNAQARLAALRATFQLSHGQLAEVQQWADSTRMANEASLAAIQRHLRVRLLIAQVRIEPQPALIEEATALLEAVSEVAEAKGWMGYLIENRLLRALLFQAQRDRPAAHATLLQALALGQPEAFQRIFVDEGEVMRTLLIEIRLGVVRKTIDEPHAGFQSYLDRLVAALGPSPSASDGPSSPSQLPNQNLVEPLTEREIEILHLVDEGLSNNEIAERLIVTVGTVKKHLNNIFGKLAVTSRTQALASARALDLL